MYDRLTMIEIFSGIGAQAKALDTLPISHEVVATMDVDKDAILSYAAMRYDLKKEMEMYNFPSKEQMVSELQNKNVGYDFAKSKHTITMRTNESKVKQYYIADKLSKNLGDVSLCKELPYVDIIFHSSPCQSFSQAGKGAGGDEGSGTTSSLMWESLRLIGTSKCKYIVWENVAAVLSGKHKHNFIKYLERLSELGYESAFDLLNSKDYGVPQNRLRIFCVSRKIENVERNKEITINKYKSTNKQVINVMKEIKESHPNIKIWEDYEFPKIIPLTTRLKDILETNVDERYYISNDRVNQILNSDFLQEKLRARNNISDENPVRLTNIYGEQFGTGYAGNVWDKNGLSPTLQTAQGGNRQPLVVDEEPIIVASRGRNPDNPSDRTTGAPTEQRLEPNLNGTTNCLTSVAKDNYVLEPQVLRAERTEYGKAIRKQYEAGEIQEKIGNMREMRPRTDGISNTITTVQKDNYVCEPIVCEERRDEGLRFFKDDCCGTLRTIDACGDKRVLEPDVTTIKVRNQATEFAGCTDVAGTLMARDYKGFGNQEMTAVVEKTYEPETDKIIKVGQASSDGSQSGMVYSPNGIFPTICACTHGYAIGNIVDNNIKYRIRKLTPTECWRLMGFTDEDCNRAAQYVSASSLYKQAGNSIVTNCLVAIFYSLFYKDSSDAYSKYLIDFHSK